MRWDAQKLAVDDPVLPGLALPGLLRTVRTPEFAGITFHEVAARSALNKVPAASRMPFRWTINPMRGCSHACAYCLHPDTLVTMADGRQRAIADLAVGALVVGTKVEGRYRRYVATPVLDVWTTRKRAYRIELADGTWLVASGDHRFRTARGWKHVTGSGSGSGRRPHLTLNDKLVGTGSGLSAGQPVVGRRAELPERLRVVAIDDLGVEIEMRDITTGSSDFVANGVLSHNCFARPTHEYLELDAGHDFESQIVVKTNVVEVLRAELARPSWAREHVALGTNTDPYQRAEGRYAFMPGIVEALAEHGTPLSILTKGTLLRRDLPVLAAAAERVPIGIGVSLAIGDEALQQSVEPGTPTPRARLDLIRAVRDAGLDCGVMVAPVLPWLTDTTQHLDDLLGRLAEAGATGVTVLPLHLRGSVKPLFLGWLREHHPGLVARYESLYGPRAYAPVEYTRWLSDRVRPLLVRHGFARGAGRSRDDDEGAFPRGSLPPMATPEAATPGLAQPTLF